MAKAKEKSDYKQYPQHQATRCGIKVSWNYYADRKDAEAAQEAARHNARIQEMKGYDFGYQSPGAIRGPLTKEHGEQYEGLYEVCLP